MKKPGDVSIVISFMLVVGNRVTLLTSGLCVKNTRKLRAN